MIRNLTSQQIILIAIATLLLLLIAFSFYLLQDPTAPLPFAPAPLNTLIPQPPTATLTPLASDTSLPTRQTSYTPFATRGTQAPTTPPVVTGTPPTGTFTPASTALTGTPTATLPAGTTATPSTTATSGSPSPTSTLESGQFGVTGRILQDGTPAPSVVIRFADDDPSRQSSTNPGGHYWFITLAPGTNFRLTFNRSDNPQLTPTAEIASRAYIEGTLPTGANVINLPDLDVSLDIGGMIFELETPSDGAQYFAAAITPSNPVQFNWTLYSQGDAYFIELGPNGSLDPIWTSSETTTTNLMWNGTLSDGTHISQGVYWWRVGVKKTVGAYTLYIFTQEWDLVFTP